MQIHFIRNDDDWFADRIEIAKGTAVSPFFTQRLQYGHLQDYLIGANRQPTTADMVL